MDTSDPALMMVGMVVSTIGTGVFVYGKKAGNGKCLLIGILLAVAPAFLSSVWADLGLAAACGLGLYVLPGGTS